MGWDYSPTVLTAERTSRYAGLPPFPQFRPIEIIDRSRIERLTAPSPFASDFSFANLWAWGFEGRRALAELDGNLVVYGSDYLGQGRFLSFVGSHAIEETARTLLDYCPAFGIPPVLQMIPEEIATTLKSADLRVEEDPCQFDYLYDVSALGAGNGPSFKAKRRQAARFLRDHPKARFVATEHQAASTRGQIQDLYANGDGVGHRYERPRLWPNELAVLDRLLNNEIVSKLIVSCVSVEGTLMGLSIDEVLPQRRALSHFHRTRYDLRGLDAFLNIQVARYLERHGVDVWNWEQDLGLDGLREWKQSYRPIGFVRKFRVSRE